MPTLPFPWFPSLLDSLCLGMLLAIAGHHGLLFLSTRRPLLGHFALYALGIAGSGAALVVSAFPGTLPWLWLASAVAVGAYGLFVAGWFETRERAPAWLHRSLLWAAAANGLGALPALTGWPAVAMALPVATGLAIHAAALTIALQRVRDGSRPARCLVAASLLLATGLGLQGLAMQGGAETLGPGAGLWFGLVGHVLLLAFGLVDEMTTAQAEQQAAQERAHAERVEGLEALIAQRSESLAQATRKLSELSITDPQSGAYNQRHFEAVFGARAAQRRRDGVALALCLIDLDHFKRFNDQYGHPAGDRVLRLVAGAMRQHLRRGDDALYRVGGDEFAILLSMQRGTRVERVAEYIECLRAAIQGLQIPHERNASGVVTASFGVVVVDDPACRATAQDIQQAADRKLYECKHAGRNRVGTTLLTSASMRAALGRVEPASALPVTDVQAREAPAPEVERDAVETES